MRSLLTCVAAVLAVLASAGPAAAQGELALILNPELNELRQTGSLAVTHYGDADVSRGGDTFSMTEMDTKGTIIYSPDDWNARVDEGKCPGRWMPRISESTELIVSHDSQVLYLHGSPRLPHTKVRLPGELRRFDLSLTYRRFLDNGWLVAATTQLGYASDTTMLRGVEFTSPFEPDQAHVGFRLLASIPHLEYTRLVLFLDANSGRSIPVAPGVGYAFPLSRTAVAMVGIPACAAGGTIGEHFDFSAFYLMTRGGELEVGWTFGEETAEALLLPENSNLRAFAGVSSRRESFVPGEREKWDDRLIFEQKEISAGIEWSLPCRFKDKDADVSVSLRGGYASDRSFAYGNDEHDEDRSRLDMDNTWFAGLEAGIEW